MRGTRTTLNGMLKREGRSESDYEDLNDTAKTRQETRMASAIEMINERTGSLVTSSLWLRKEAGYYGEDGNSGLSAEGR